MNKKRQSLRKKEGMVHYPIVLPATAWGIKRTQPPTDNTPPALVILPDATNSGALLGSGIY
jgi:hypothetical protein